MPKVLLIGWDGAGWDRVHPLMDSGAMPNLAGMVDKGSMGDTGVLTPLCSPLLWTSVATGLNADRHGVLDQVEPDPVTAGVRPLTRASVQAIPVWDLLAREGLRCQVIGWPATHPASGPATCVSDGFAFGLPDTVRPQSLEPRLLPLRFKPNEWTGDELALFVPELTRIDQDKDKRLAKLAVILAEAVSVHAAATTLLETDEWDFAAVWFGVLGRAAEIFPDETVDEVYKDVISGIYRFLDLFLGRLLSLAGPETIVMLVSDRTAGASEWRDSVGRGARGMLCATGPGIEADKLTFGTGLLDVTPTILSLFGFSPVPEMPGRAIVEITHRPPARALRTPVQLPKPEPDFADAIELEDFGYTDSIAASWRAEADAARRRRDLHLARVLMSQNRSEEAIPLLQRLSAETPDAIDIRLFLGHALFQHGRIDECRSICETLVAECPDSPYASVGRAHLALAEGAYAEAVRHLAAGRGSWGMIATLDAVVGEAYLRMARYQEAAAAFRSAVATDPDLAAAHEGLARALLAIGNHEEAAESALDAIRLRYDQPGAHETLARALRALGRKKEAAEATRASEMLRGRQSVA